MSNNDYYPTEIPTCVDELDLDEHHITGFDELELELMNLVTFNSHEQSIDNVIYAFNRISNLIEDLLQFIVKASDLYYEQPATIDQKIYNIRLMEYTVEYIRQLNQKILRYGINKIFKSVNRFRVFNFNVLDFDTETRKQLNNDKFKPFKEVHDIKEVVMKPSRRHDDFYIEQIQRALKRIEERNKQLESKKD